MSFKCPACHPDDPMRYITKQHLDLHIIHVHPEVAKMTGKDKK